MESRTCIDEFQNENDIREYLEESTDNIVVCVSIQGIESYYCESRSDILIIMRNLGEYRYPRYNQLEGYNTGRGGGPYWNDKDMNNFINSLDDENNCFYKLYCSPIYVIRGEQYMLSYMDVSGIESYTYDEIMPQLE
jgi:hypothetical protein